MVKPADPDTKREAVRLVRAGWSCKAAARKVGVTDTTVRM